MKNVLAKVILGAALLMAAGSSHAWWGGNGWGNYWPVWTPMYWMDEVAGDDWGPWGGYGYPYGGYGYPYGGYGYPYGGYSYPAYGYGYYPYATTAPAAPAAAASDK